MAHALSFSKLSLLSSFFVLFFGVGVFFRPCDFALVAAAILVACSVVVILGGGSTRFLDSISLPHRPTPDSAPVIVLPIAFFFFSDRLNFLVARTFHYSFTQ
jgi:hypothetical protein